MMALTMRFGRTVCTEIWTVFFKKRDARYVSRYDLLHI